MYTLQILNFKNADNYLQWAQSKVRRIFGPRFTLRQNWVKLQQSLLKSSSSEKFFDGAVEDQSTKSAEDIIL